MPAPFALRANEARPDLGGGLDRCSRQADLQLPASGRHYHQASRKQKAPTKAGAFRTTGAGNRNRTYDLRITNAPLYQLSYSG